MLGPRRVRPKLRRARGAPGLRDPCLALEGETDAHWGTTQRAGWVHSIRSPSVRFCGIQFGRPTFLGVGGPRSACRAEGARPLVLVAVLLPACPGPRGPHPAASPPCGSGSVQATQTPAGGGRGWGRVGVHSLTSPQAHVSSAPAQASFSAQCRLCAGRDRGSLPCPLMPQCAQCVLVFLSSGSCDTLAAFLELGPLFRKYLFCSTLCDYSACVLQRT